jgi:hypothetical protein
LPASTSQSVSGFVSLNPPSAVEQSIAVSAFQRINGISVVVKSQTADVQTDAGVQRATYSLTLPVGAPVFGQFGAGTSAIVLTPVPLAAAIYDVEAAAAGYLPQFPTISVANGSVTQDFALVF